MKSVSSRSTAWAAIATFAICLILTAVRSTPPEAVDTGSTDRFSANRAARVLESIYADGVTHPTGTENNRKYKQRLLEHLRRLGYQPTVQREFVCRDTGGCGHVENILARLEGTDPGKAVLLAVHYDSVGAGPSVSDDGVAVAASLEIARLLRTGSQPRNDVIFLIDDGEEVALLGAIAFAARHPWAEDVGAVVNLEARGTAGRSYMFETDTDNAWLIDLMKRHVPRPATSSFYYSIYKRLPNDTDFTIFKKYGLNGVNFAFIRNLVHYHTPLDDLDHWTPATMQHQGENALAMVRALAEADLVSPPAGTSSWFDIWGFGIISWPEPWNLPLAILSLVLISAATGIHLFKGRLAVTEIAWGQVLFPAALLGSVLLAVAVGWFLTALGKLPAWPASSWPPKMAFWLIGLTTPALVVSWIGRRAGPAAAWLGALEWLGLLALICSILLPGAAYLFSVPALVGGLLALAFAVWRTSPPTPFALLLTIVAACMVQLNLAWSLWEAMGIKIMPLVTFLVAGIFTLTLTPRVAPSERTRIRLPLLGLALALFLAAISLILPAYSSESPRPINFYFVQDADQRSAKLTLDPGRRPMPESLASAVEWRSGVEPIYPWLDSRSRFHAAEIEPLPVLAPTLDILQQESTGEGRRMIARLKSPRRADRVAVVFHDPARITSLRLDGWDLDLEGEAIRRWQRRGRRVVSSATIPDEGIEVILEITGNEPVELTLLDYSYGLPPAADHLLRARPADVVPIDRGDQTVVYAKAAI